MKQGRFYCAIGCAIALAAGLTFGQLPTTQLTSIFPPGGKVGTALAVSIAGNEMDEVERLVFNHPGLTAAPQLTAASELAPARPIANQFTVTIGEGVPPGIYEVRAVGRFGVSNPRMFVVGSAPEVVEQSANNAADKAIEVPLGSTLSGRTQASAFDFLRLNLKEGQRVVVEVAARRIDSRLDGTLVLLSAEGRELARAKGGAGADPVLDFTAPATGTYLVKLYDAVYGGGDDYFYRFTASAAPFVDFVFPPSGPAGSQNQYFLYGRNLPGGEPVPGLSIGNVPLQRLPVIIPLPGETTSQPSLAIEGLAPVRQAWQDAIQYRLPTPQGLANPVSVCLSKTPTVIAEQEPNDESARAQRIAVPCEVVGQFYPESDVDWVQFDAKKGETYWIEAISSQLGLASDPVISLSRLATNEKGDAQLSEVAQADDSDERGRRIGGDFDPTSDDPAYKFVVSEDGTYRLMIRDQFGDTRKDPSFVYRLAIRKPAPDFRLLAYPSPPPASQQTLNATPLASACVRRGGTTAVGVALQRRDEFAGEVTVEVQGLPAGIKCSGAVLGGSVEEGLLIFVAAEDAAAWAGPIKVIGKTMIDGREVVREARYAVAVWGSPNRQVQAAEFRLTPSLSLGVIDKDTEVALVQAGDDKVWETTVGGKIEIPITIKRRGEFKDAVKLTAVGLPNQLRPKEMTMDGNKAQEKLELRFDRDGQKAGAYTFYLRGETKTKYAKNPQAVATAEAEQKRLAEMIKQLADSVKSLTEAKDEAGLKAAQEKLKQAEELKGQAEKRVSEAKQQSQAKDVTFALVSTPIRVRVLPAPAKK